jgi:thioredoxin domain-containing protein 5
VCSKRLAPTWEELGKALEGEDGVEVATVDCTTNKATCGKADIRSYPTLKLFLNGEEYKKYSGMVPLAVLPSMCVCSIGFQHLACTTKPAHKGLHSCSACSHR